MEVIDMQESIKNAYEHDSKVDFSRFLIVLKSYSGMSGSV